MNDLFQPFKLNDTITLDNRILMAPLTRCMADDNLVPTQAMVDYYARRADTGLIISEATIIRPDGQGYPNTPGLFTAQQIAGWRKVTDKVHEHGGKIFAQLWHTGRVAHPHFFDGDFVLAPSALRVEGTVPRMRELTYTTPKAASKEEIEELVEDFAQAAINALEAGFDGVEIHAANGYLIDEFLRSTSNRRMDAYGGSQENRIRFAQEVAEAVSKVMGAERTGIRFSPFITQRGMDDPAAPQTILKLAGELDKIGLAYVHLAEADWDDAPETPESFRAALREVYSGTVIVAGGYTKVKADRILADGYADLVAFGRPFIANPDFPRRLADGVPLSDFDGSTLFGGDAAGYTSYPEAA